MRICISVCDSATTRLKASLYLSSPTEVCSVFSFSENTAAGAKFSRAVAGLGISVQQVCLSGCLSGCLSVCTSPLFALDNRSPVGHVVYVSLTLWVMEKGASPPPMLPPPHTLTLPLKREREGRKERQAGFGKEEQWGVSRFIIITKHMLLLKK